jgi:hypothetical protein
MGRLGTAIFRRDFPGQRNKGPLIFLPRQQGAPGSDIGERTHGGGLCQKHFIEDDAIVGLHPEVSIDSQSMTEDNIAIILIIIARNSRAKCRK